MQYIKDSKSSKLIEMRQQCQDWIDGPENDGRLTAGSSAHLDYCFDEIDAIDKELELRDGSIQEPTP